MTDIPPLIERLRKWPRPDCPLPSEALADMREAAEALSLAVSPLAGEIAGLMALKEGLPYHGNTSEGEFRISNGNRIVALAYSLEFARAIVALPVFADALERLAREIAEKDRLREKAIAHYSSVIDDYAARIRELEAERDAIKAKTVEDIASFVG